MDDFATFSDSFTAVVIGAGGGIGAALVARLAASPAVRQVHALSRHPVEARAGIIPGVIELSDEASIAAAASAVRAQGSPALVIVASGILHAADGLMPEKSMMQLTGRNMSRVLDINTVGPALAAAHFLPLLARGQKSVLAVLSARVGSISDNRLGGWVSYRASKAALNMVVKTFAVEHARKFPESAVVSLHPGTVDTALSAPFSARTEPAKLFTPDHAAARLLGVVNDLAATDTGGFFAWDGQPIPW